MKRLASTLAALLLFAGLSIASGSTAFAAPQTVSPMACCPNPPCPPVVRDADLWFGATRVAIDLYGEPSGYMGNCSYRFHENVASNNSSQVYGYWSIRVWINGRGQGDYGTSTYYDGSARYPDHYVTPWFYYGNNSPSADNWNEVVCVGGSCMHVQYRGTGYLLI